MNDPAVALQRAIFLQLRDDPGVSDLVAGRVYDLVPQNARFPYLQIGDDQVVSNEDGCGFGSEVFAQVHIWSREPGRIEAKTIAGAVRAALSNPISVVGFIVDEHQYRNGRVFPDPDGKTSHGIVEFRFLIRPNP